MNDDLEPRESILFDVNHEFSKSSLNQTYLARIAGSRTRGRDGLSANHFSSVQIDELLTETSQKLLSGTYSFTAYRELLKLKGVGKAPRIISIPTLQDRLVLSRLSSGLRNSTPSIKFPRPQEIVAEIRKAINSGMFSDFMRLDIVNFYPSISHEALKSSLEIHRIPDEVIGLILTSIQNPTIADGPITPTHVRPTKGVPAGTSIANVLGEFSLNALDESLNSRPNIAYFRYVDDILILSPRGQRTELGHLVKLKLREVGLRSHSKKTLDKTSSGSLKKLPFEYLGYTFSKGTVSVHKSRQSKLIDSLARPLTMLRRAIQENSSDLVSIKNRAEWWLNFRITGCKADNARRGWLPYYSQIDSPDLLHHLDSVVNKLNLRLPAELRIEPKSFLTAYRLIRDPARDTGEYIPDFDSIVEYADMRELLLTASDYRNLPPDGDQLRRLFRKFISFAVKELETDVGALS